MLDAVGTTEAWRACRIIFRVFLSTPPFGSYYFVPPLTFLHELHALSPRNGNLFFSFFPWHTVLPQRFSCRALLPLIAVFLLRFFCGLLTLLCASSPQPQTKLSSSLLRFFLPHIFGRASPRAFKRPLLFAFLSSSFFLQYLPWYLARLNPLFSFSLRLFCRAIFPLRAWFLLSSLSFFAPLLKAIFEDHLRGSRVLVTPHTQA